MWRQAILLVVFLVIGGPSHGDDEGQVLRGRVVDSQGQPVADASVTTVWNANGVTLEHLRKVEKEGGEHPEFTMNEGRMEPWGSAPCKTDADGRFSMNVHSREYKLLAIDKERKRGSLLLVDPHNPRSPLEGQLVPLVRLQGRVSVAATGEATRDVTVMVGLPATDDFPLGRNRLALCSSVKSRFEFWLPPGDYQLEAFCHDPQDLRLAELHSIRLTVNQPEFDAGVLAVTPKPKDELEEAKKSGTWIDAAKRIGQPAPRWQAIDARGMPRDAQASHFRGKWVLLYFWGLSCPPCLKNTLPKLGEFYETHAAQRDRFEIVAICCDANGKLNSMADLDRRLKPVVTRVWRGKELPFPQLLDNTTKTLENFGMDNFGTLLIDPAGRLVEGDETTLAKKLEMLDPKNPP